MFDGVKVLIVEDERLILEDLATTLKSHGFQVSGLTTSGREAIEAAKNDPPDVILMDVKLKGDLNGIETAIVIQGALDRSIPTIFLTAFNTDEFPYLPVVDNCLHLNKPYSEEDLLACIEKVLAKKTEQL
jgi:DNA-binding response OmpR family regulator